ncbi:hypothetical protein [Luteibacter sp. CQ10]|uniref:hypothetical protein n=1 Tax=Luteibacter sp. CQ10 TaxID=2805821 RepID=UPI0034A11424
MKEVITMHTVKLTVFIEDSSDVDMEVRLAVPRQTHPTIASPSGRSDSDPIEGRVDDDYVLGGYAGI